MIAAVSSDISLYACMRTNELDMQLLRCESALVVLTTDVGDGVAG